MRAALRKKEIVKIPGKEEGRTSQKKIKRGIKKHKVRCLLSKKNLQKYGTVERRGQENPKRRDDEEEPTRNSDEGT